MTAFQAGIVGKPNVGKSTFFAAATLAEVKIAPYPFTTIKANKGIGYVKIKCVCREFGVNDMPINSFCVNGYRFIPVELIDVAGLVPGAREGRGLGNQFLSELSKADVLIHIVDAAGMTDSEGRPVKPGSHDPLEDVNFLAREIDLWMVDILQRNWRKILRVSPDPEETLTLSLSGLNIKRQYVEQALKLSGLYEKPLKNWCSDDIMSFITTLRQYAKPMLIAANKCDIPEAEENIKRLKEAIGDKYVIPTSAEAELALRRAAAAGLINYMPGDGDFEIIDEKKLGKRQTIALEYIRERVLSRWGSTGVQKVINRAFLDILGMIAVFPVEDENSLTDHKGNILPDAWLVPPGTTPRQLAYMIHTELGEKFIAAIDVRTKRALPSDAPLRHRAVVKIRARR